MLTPVKPKGIFIVVPAFNEDAVINAVVGKLSTHNYKVLIVDDGSAIPVLEILKHNGITILRHAVNMGQGAALQTGIEYSLHAGAKYIVTFDADGQHQAEDIMKLILPLINNEADITLGSRFLKGSWHNMTLKRKILIQFARVFNFLLTGLFLSDAHNGLRAMNSKAANTICLQQNGMAHATELLTQIKRNQLRWKEVPVSIQYSNYSRKKGQTVWSGFRIFFDLLLNKFFK